MSVCVTYLLNVDLLMKSGHQTKASSLKILRIYSMPVGIHGLITNHNRDY